MIKTLEQMLGVPKKPTPYKIKMLRPFRDLHILITRSRESRIKERLLAQ